MKNSGGKQTVKIGLVDKKILGWKIGGKIEIFHKNSQFLQNCPKLLTCGF